jgi:hypothetical protein
MAVVQKPIEDRCGNHLTAAHLSPIHDGKIGISQDSTADRLVALGVLAAHVSGHDFARTKWESATFIASVFKTRTLELHFLP